MTKCNQLTPLPFKGLSTFHAIWSGNGFGIIGLGIIYSSSTALSADGSSGHFSNMIWRNIKSLYPDTTLMT